MATSCYFDFGRKPGLNGNSVYFITTGDNKPTAGQIKQTDKGSMMDAMEDATNLITDDTINQPNDYSKINISNAANTFIPALGTNYNEEMANNLAIQSVSKQHIVSTYAMPTLNNTHGIIDGNWQNDDDGMDKFKHKQQMDSLSTVAIDDDSISTIQSRKKQTESAYINMPNLYNCINISDQEHHRIIRSPIIEKYVIEKPEMENDKDAEDKILIPNFKQFSDDYTPDDISDMYTTYNFDVSTIESEYAFNIEEYDNTNEKFLHSNESNKIESRNEISANKEKFPNSYISKIETDPDKDTTSTLIASEKPYIESYYNAGDLHQWKVY
ncbi:unnamed protein product [Acanthocheilonema viteae]|uniref:Uncharacterized protein n=1 Tax=Acanthocheilonema viteae TaxID=6277 RepID=A0A498STJ6_ACAVI|nr:unnamed protein product [Acanthocheilonema viteae]